LRILIGLGANLGDPPSAFGVAIGELSKRHRVVASSSIYGSRPVGPAQPDFHNMAVLLEVGCAALALLDECQQLEQAAARNRDQEERWGPRPLDIDLLMVRNLVHRGPRLELPHPRFSQRAFAVIPAAEIAPDWVVPFDGRTIEERAGILTNRDPRAVWKVEMQGS
jgi:2-amino-4-hydroxy-6-hydroxymethyldihydropteridine diphosphokinase